MRNQDAIFNFIYELSLRDATLQKAYAGSLDELRNNDKAKGYVKEYIDKLMNNELNDNSFLETAEKVENAFDGYKPTFTFGNVQKLINMSVKYMFIACYNNKEARELFRLCHCPMDSIMVDVVINQLKEKGEFNNLLKGKATFLRQGWSKIKSEGCYSRGELPEQYERFQKIVRFLADEEGCNPIEYDYKMWGQSK